MVDDAHASEPFPSSSLRPLPELAAEIAAGAVRLSAATAAWLGLVAEFDEREGWAGYGIRSCAEWLAWQCGLSPGPAREHVRVARALRELPLMRAAFTAGRISYSKVRALTRVAEPATEGYLLEFAHEATASQVERAVRQWRRADRNDRDDNDNDNDNEGDGDGEQARQQLDWWWDESGMLVLKARLAPEPGAAFLAALESRAERDARRERAAAKKARLTTGRARGAAGAAGDEDEAVAAGRARTTARRLAALTALAEQAADRGRRPGDPPRREVIVHVDAAVLAEDTAAGRAWIEGGPALSAAQARRLACEGSVVAMLSRGREVLAVGRKRRLATRAQRRALLRRDGGCARPGCTEIRIERLHAHHLRHWLHGGRTELTNLVLLCDTCHGLAHDLDLVMTRRNGRLVVTTSDGHRVWGAPDAAFTTGLPGPNPGADTDTDTDADADACGDPDDADFVGVHPIDTARGRRPDLPEPTTTDRTTTPDPAVGVSEPRLDRCTPGRRSGRRPQPARRRRTASRPPGTSTRPGAAPPTSPTRPATGRRGHDPGAAEISALLFPEGEPPLPDAMHVNGERMDLRYVVNLLMEHRDAVHRWATESGTSPGDGAKAVHRS